MQKLNTQLGTQFEKFMEPSGVKFHWKKWITYGGPWSFITQTLFQFTLLLLYDRCNVTHQYPALTPPFSSCYRDFPTSLGLKTFAQGIFIKAPIKQTVVDMLYSPSVSLLLFAGNLVTRVEARLVCNSQFNFTCILCSTQRQSPFLSQRFILNIHSICYCLLSVYGIISFSMNSTGVYWVQLWSTLWTFSKNRRQE